MGAVNVVFLKYLNDYKTLLTFWKVYETLTFIIILGKLNYLPND